MSFASLILLIDGNAIWRIVSFTDTTDTLGSKTRHGTLLSFLEYKFQLNLSHKNPTKAYVCYYISSLFEMNMTQKNFMKSSIDRPINMEIEKSLDTFKLGLMLLECAIGGF